MHRDCGGTERRHFAHGCNRFAHHVELFDIADGGIQNRCIGGLFLGHDNLSVDSKARMRPGIAGRLVDGGQRGLQTGVIRQRGLQRLIEHFEHLDPVGRREKLLGFLEGVESSFVIGTCHADADIALTQIEILRLFLEQVMAGQAGIVMTAEGQVTIGKNRAAARHGRGPA